MRHLILAGMAVASLATSATAQQTCEQHRENRTLGTVGGAGIGAVLGGAIGGNALGAILGAVGGGVAGNQLLKGPQDCQHAYGYYDKQSQWHASRVAPASATGFYDRDGRWVQGAPAGYYDRDGRWVAGDANRGYRDANGYWVPAGATTYYSADGQYLTAQPANSSGQRGYGDQRAYGNDQRADANDQRGYNNDQRGYNNDQRGYNNDQRGYANDGRSDDWRNDNRSDVRGRIDRTAERIDRSVARGAMRSDQANAARRDLDEIRRQVRTSPRVRGQLTVRSQQLLNNRIDAVNSRIRDTQEQARTNY